jgi:hypothetical protein
MTITAAEIFAIQPTSVGQIGPVHPTFFRNWERAGDMFTSRPDLPWTVSDVHAQEPGGRGPCAKLARHVQVSVFGAPSGIGIVLNHYGQILTSKGWV